MDKGDDETPNYRSRLVAREIRKKGENQMFALTPPRESLAAVLPLAAADIRNALSHDKGPESTSVRK